MKLHRYFIVIGFAFSCAPLRYNYYFDFQQTAPSKIPVSESNRIIPAPRQDALGVSTVRVADLSTTNASRKTIASIKSLYDRNQLAPIRTTKGQKKEAVNYAVAESSGRMDTDVRRSIIFGASGLVALFIGGQLFWVLGSLCLVIALIFGIKWVLRH